MLQHGAFGVYRASTSLRLKLLDLLFLSPIEFSAFMRREKSVPSNLHMINWISWDYFFTWSTYSYPSVVPMWLIFSKWLYQLVIVTFLSLCVNIEFVTYSIIHTLSPKPKYLAREVCRHQLQVCFAVLGVLSILV